MLARFGLWALAGLVLLVGCKDDEPDLLSARQITHHLELIGGPLAHGQVGDYLLENDKVRFVITGAHHSWGPGLFGGTVVDADVRRTEPWLTPPYSGNDQFAELFTTVNLLVPNPGSTEITVVHDGKDGQMAQIRVAGEGLFYLEALSILDPVEGSFAPILGTLDVKTTFNFVTTYTLRPGNAYLEIDTEVRRPDTALTNPVACEGLPANCDLDCPLRTDLATNCLKCECDPGLDLPLFTDSVPLLGRILGDTIAPTGSNTPLKPGIVGGDFVFFGGSTDVFAPGLGFDPTGAIFDNLFRGVDTITSPLSFDWIGAAGTDVSYALFSRRDETPETCQRRVVLTAILDPTRRSELEQALRDNYGLTRDRVRIGLNALALQGIHMAIVTDLPESEAAAKREELEDLVDGLALVDVELDGACRDPKLLVPLFTSSATMVASSGVSCQNTSDADDATCDELRTFRFKRYLAVGHGDIATASKVVFDAQGIPRGRLQGVVFDGTNGRPARRADVFAVRDPDPATEFTHYDQVFEANLAIDNSVGVMNHALADVGTDPRRNGDWEMTLPAGSWLLVARSADGVVSKPLRVTVADGSDQRVNLEVEAPGRLEYRVVDESGQLMPAKLTVVALGADGEPVYGDGKRRVELGQSRMDDGIFQVTYSHTGEGTTKLEPGRYRVTVSRGFEYGIHTQDVTIESARSATVSARLVREVDTTGFIAADFHLHASPSMDSGMPLDLRVITNIVEGVELLSSSDHDIITDYEPYLRALGLERWATTQVGLEVSTLELGHTLGFPLRYDFNDRPVHGAIDWVCKNHEETWRELRNLGEFGPDRTVTVVAHPRDGFFGYFDQFKLNPWDLTRGEGGLEANNPLFRTLSCDFDAIEVFNAKRHELVHTPTNAEINDTTRCLNELNEAITPAEIRGACEFLKSRCAGEATEYQGDPCRWYRDLEQDMGRCQDEEPLRRCRDKARNAVTKFSIRRILRRTEAEQTAWLQADEARRNPDAAKCSPTFLDEYVDCLAQEAEDNPDATEAEVIAACEADVGYVHSDDPLASDHTAPCSQHQGVAEDWFGLLNYGLPVTALGNSDSHGTTLEPGIPRNWVRSSTDDASHIDRGEIADAVKRGDTLPSTGPFVRATIRGAGYGQTADLTAGGNVELALQVQTPSWFGVSRIEVYRNGAIVHERDIDPDVAATIDFDEVIDLGRPTEDSWYVVAVMGLRNEDFMDPVYVTIALGELGLDKITSLAFANLGAISGFLDSEQQLPDYFPSIPYAMTNPIYVDIDGDGYAAPNGPPPFCPVSCTPVLGDDGVPTQSDCVREDEVCWPNDQVGRLEPGGTCGRPILGDCGGEPLGQQTGALTVGGAQRTPHPLSPGTRAPRLPPELLKSKVGKRIWDAFEHGLHVHPSH